MDLRFSLNVKGDSCSGRIKLCAAFDFRNSVTWRILKCIAFLIVLLMLAMIRITGQRILDLIS